MTNQYIAFAAAFIIGLAKGGLPAIGMLAVPMLALTMPPIKAVVLLLPVYLVSDVVAVYLYRRHYSAWNLKILVPAALVGVLLGWSTAAYLSDLAISALIGALGVGFCLNAWLRRQPDASPRKPDVTRGIFWGVLSGFTSFVSHSGAPPFQIYVLPQRLPKLVFAGTSTILFAVINSAKLVPYMQLRPYTMGDVSEVAALLPAALVGTIVGAWLTKRVQERWFFLAVQIALFAVSLKLLAGVFL